MPESNWLFLGLIETKNLVIIDEIARKIIDKDVCYTCCTGTYEEKMHDIIDENIVIRQCEIEKNHLPNHFIITTSHKNIEEGLWFASFSAQHETELIDKIYCLDVGKDSNKERILKLIDKFQ